MLPPSADQPDVAGLCLGCRTIVLLPRSASDPGLAGGRVPAAPCDACGGLVVAVDAATDRLTGAVETLRRTDPVRRATVRALAESWQRVEPSPLAAVAELGPVAPGLVEVLGVAHAPIGVRLAVGALLVSLLLPLLAAADSDEPAERAAARVLAERIGAAPAPV